MRLASANEVKLGLCSIIIVFQVCVRVCFPGIFQENFQKKKV